MRGNQEHGPGARKQTLQGGSIWHSSRRQQRQSSNINCVGTDDDHLTYGTYVHICGSAKLSVLVSSGNPLTENHPYTTVRGGIVTGLAPHVDVCNAWRMGIPRKEWAGPIWSRLFEIGIKTGPRAEVRVEAGSHSWTRTRS